MDLNVKIMGNFGPGENMPYYGTRDPNNGVGRKFHLVTFSDRKAVEEGIKNGWPAGRIAKALGRSHSCIKQEIRRAGGREKYTADQAQKLSDIRQKAKRENLMKGITEEEEAKILECTNNGDSINKMYDKIKISRWRICRYLREHNVKSPHKNYTAFEERLSAIEMQLEIIFEQLKL